MRVDLAKTFLEALTGSASTPVSWQTFSDRKPNPLPRGYRDPLARVLHGTLDAHAGRLEELNGAGAGIFVTVSETNLRGRSATDVVALRALFADVDDVQPELRVAPSFSTVTARGRNPFWRLRTGEPVCRFREAQARLAATYGTDASVKDPSRVMRCPGFMHRKAEPRLVDFSPGDSREWRIGELLELHPPVAEAPKRPAVLAGTPIRLSLAGQGRTGALMAIARQKAAERDWTETHRHLSTEETATHATKLGLGPDAVRSIVVEFASPAGLPDQEVDGLLAWAEANVSPDPKELADRPPEVAARKQLEKGAEDGFVARQLARWYGLTEKAAAEIVAKVSAAMPQQMRKSA